jgi:hypothetical protein
MYGKKTIVLLLERFAEDKRLSAEEKKRLLQIILLKIDQWKAR